MKKYIYIALSSLIVAGCTGNFDEIDTDKSGVVTETTPGGVEKKDPAINYLSLAQRLIYPDDSGPYPIAAWVLQVQTNLSVDIWAGYLASGTRFQGGRNNQSYDLVDGWNAYMLDYWNKTMAQVNDMKLSYEALTAKTAQDHTTRAMGILTKIIASERAADMYGTIPYTSYGSTAPKYDSLEDIYKKFFSEIDDAQALLTQGESLSSNAEKDLFYQGNKDKWARLSNTLRLRLALRIVKADPVLAKQQAEKALSNSFGLIQDNTQNAGFTGAYLNGLCVLAQSWGDTRMSADMESILVGYNDPRLPIYFSQNNGKYRGVRVGSNFDKNSGTNYSSLGTAFPAGATYATAPVYLVNAAESWFLRAEAALRNYAGAGDVTTNYNKGIEMSMNQYGVTDDAVITAYKNSQNKPIDWVSADQKIATTMPAACKITPNFGDATDNESKLEKIITQKWIAMFPGGSTVAWSEYRRTGYPRMLAPFMTYSAPTVSVTYGPKIVNNAKRAAIPKSQYQDNYENVTTAVQTFLGNKDFISTPVWWDKDVPNI